MKKKDPLFCWDQTEVPFSLFWNDIRSANSMSWSEKRSSLEPYINFLIKKFPLPNFGNSKNNFSLIGPEFIKSWSPHKNYLLDSGPSHDLAERNLILWSSKLWEYKKTPKFHVKCTKKVIKIEKGFFVIKMILKNSLVFNFG